MQSKTLRKNTLNILNYTKQYMQTKRVSITLLLIFGLLFSVFPLSFAQQQSSTDYIEYPTQTFVFERQDYFSQFLEFDFGIVGGLTEANLKVNPHVEWLVSWRQKDYLELYDEATQEINYIPNPIGELQEQRNNNTFLDEKFTELQSLSGFKNKGNFVSDVKRFSNYPVSVLPQQRNEFVREPISFIDLTQKEGNFTFTLKEWKHGIYVNIGFGSAITYSAPTNTITVTGYTSGTPCTFTDVYNADVAGGWGQVSLQGTNQFLFNCKLQIGDGSTATWFKDTQKQVAFVDGLPEYPFYVTASATCTLGTLKDATDKTTTDGCMIIELDNAGTKRFMRCEEGTLYLYGCTLLSLSNSGIILKGTTSRVWETKLMGGFYIQDSTTGTGCDYYHIDISEATFGLISSIGTFDEIFVSHCVQAVYIWANLVGEFQNSKFRNNNLLAHFDGTRTIDSHFLNFDVDAWNFDFNAATGGKVYRQYSFNLQVTDFDGAPLDSATYNTEVVLTKGATVLTLTTDANGRIAEQTLSKGYYDQAHGNTIQDAGDWTLDVTADGYIPQHITFSLDQKTDWISSMHAQLSGNATVSDVLVDQTFYSDDADTQLVGELTASSDIYNTRSALIILVAIVAAAIAVIVFKKHGDSS